MELRARGSRILGLEETNQDKMIRKEIPGQGKAPTFLLQLVFFYSGKYLHVISYYIITK